MKKNILIFGAMEWIYDCACEKLNFFEVNIKGFIDNNVYKQKLLFRNKPVYSISQLKDVEYDYILVGAWASYEIIKRQLIEGGVEEGKIMPLLDEIIYEKLHKGIETNLNDIIDSIYNNPQIIKKAVEKLNQLYEIYKETDALVDEENAWYLKSSLIAHACGGYVNGHKQMYTNSKEALECSLTRGFRLIECDCMRKSNTLYLAHAQSDFFGDYTILSLEEALSMLKNYPDVNLLIDIKWAEEDHDLLRMESIKEYENIIDDIEELIIKVSKDEKKAEQLRKQLVIEVYNVPTIVYVREKNFQCIYTQYRNSDGNSFMEVANNCKKYGVHVVALPVESALLKIKDLNIITNKNIKIFCFSTDDMNEYSTLLSAGVSGVFSNYLIEGKRE